MGGKVISEGTALIDNSHAHLPGRRAGQFLCHLIFLSSFRQR